MDGYLLKRFSRKLLRDLPELAGVMWHNRTVLIGVTELGRKAQKWDRLHLNLKSFTRHGGRRAGRLLMCLDFGYFQTHNEGLDEVKASEVPQWRGSPVLRDC